MALNNGGIIIRRPGMPPNWDRLYMGSGSETPTENPDTVETLNSENFNLVRCIGNVWERENQIYAPIQNRADECHRLYNMVYDHPEGNPASWEHQARYPFMANAVNRYSSTLLAMMDKTENSCQIKATAPGSQVRYNLTRKLITSFLDKGSHFGKTFRQAYRELLGYGLTTGQEHVQIFFTNTGIDTSTKATDPSEMDTMGDFIPNSDPATKSAKPFLPNPNRPELVLKVLSPTDVRRDSSEQHRYTMWRTTISRGQLREHGSSLGYDLEAVERICKTHSTNQNPQFTPGTSHKSVETGHPVDSSIPEDVELIHFEGTLEDYQQGKIVFQHKYCVVSGNEVLLVPRDIPHWDGSLSILSAPFIKKIGSVFGTSPLVESIDLQHVRNDLLNQFNNYMTLLLKPPINVEQSALDPDDPLNGQSASGVARVAPGQIIRTQTPPGSRVDAVRVIQMGELPQSAWQYLPMFNSTLQEVTGVDQDLMGMPRARGRMSAMETQSRAANGSNLVNDVFDGLDDSLLSKMLTTIFLRTLQYYPEDAWKNFIETHKAELLPTSDQSPPEVKAAWEKEISEMASWDKATRYREMAGKYSFSVNLISSVMERQAKMEQYSYFLKFVSEIPQMAQAVNFPEVLRNIATTLGLDPENFLNKSILPAPSPIDGDIQPPSGGGIPPIPNGSPDPGGAANPTPNMVTPPPGLK